jgi:surface antigen
MFRVMMIIKYLCLMLLSFPAFAENYGFLNNTAMSYFTKEDWQIYNNTRMRALNNGKDGVKIQWNNPNSGSFGYIIPSNTIHKNDIVCRKLTSYTTANRISGETTVSLCKSKNKWLIH